VKPQRGFLRSLGLLLRTAPDWFLTAFWGLIGSRVGPPVEIVQAVIVRDGAVLLGRRRDLRGWELPGGNVIPGEDPEDALRREVLEETGVEVRVEALAGVYLRSGFLPHRASVYRCRAERGSARPSDETPQVAWWPVASLPPGLLPWCRAPLADALAAPTGPPLERRERLGIPAILESARIDLRARLRGE
jgi:ADP-ribose pyrophosphatase YjhB (NUDIX family)